MRARAGKLSSPSLRLREQEIEFPLIARARAGKLSSPSLRAREQGNCEPDQALIISQCVHHAATMYQPKVEFLLYVKEGLSIFME